MKVAFVLGALNRGGTESLILDICRCANRTPFEVVCIYRKEGNLSEEFHKTNAQMIHFPKTSHLLNYLLSLRQMIKKEGVDIVHSQTPSNTMVLGLALIGTTIKLITSFHGYSFAHANCLKRKFVYQVSKKIICVSKNQQQYYQSKWHLSNDNKFHIVYNGIDVSKIIGIKYPIPDFLCNNDEEKNLVVVGNFNSVRSQDFLLQVINQLQTTLRENKIKIYFAGGISRNEEHLYQQCENYIAANQLNDIAVLLGVRKDIFAILQHIDGFLYSSRSDTFGIAVVEAMMSGVPVVTNDYIVMREITHDGAFALLYHSNNIDDCAAVLMDFINNIDKYKQNAITMMTKVQEMYAIDTHINCLKEIYDSL